MRVNWVGAEEARCRQRDPRDCGGTARSWGWGVEEAGEREGNWTRRQARPGRARRPGGGFLPSFPRVWKVDMEQTRCEISLWSCGENGPQRPESGRRGSSQEAKSAYRQWGRCGRPVSWGPVPVEASWA